MALKPEAREKRLAMARRFETSLVSKSEFCRQEKVSVCKNFRTGGLPGFRI